MPAELEFGLCAILEREMTLTKKITGLIKDLETRYDYRLDHAFKTISRQEETVN
jgi:hypothetical protein